MTVNLKPKARLLIYIVTAVGSAAVAYLISKGLIGDDELTLWVAISGLANGLAGLNTNLEENGK